MAIKKNADNHIEAEFGNGDILVSVAMHPTTKVHNTIFFENLEIEHGLIGVQHHDKNGRLNSEIPEGSIRLTFSKSESVSVVLKYLLQIRDELQRQESTSSLTK